MIKILIENPDTDAGSVTISGNGGKLLIVVNDGYLCAPGQHSTEVAEIILHSEIVDALRAHFTEGTVSAPTIIDHIDKFFREREAE